MNPSERIVYRALRKPTADRQRFQSDKEKGRGPNAAQIADPRLYTGMSAFAPRRFAAEQAHYLHLGGYLAELHVPDEVQMDQTVRPGHYTVQGDADSRLAMVRAVHDVHSVLKG